MARTAQQETELFERMTIRRAVLTLAIPTVISQLIVMVYNLADTWFIGQTGDPAQVAAVTVSYPVSMLYLIGHIVKTREGSAVQPFMECTGSVIALLLYRKERKRGLVT